ncbi:MAG TPA: tripartite tricarboxylate transporter substrate-binding protein [Hyphomicrobiaceae bacterium]|nr:tripartite tricarboxylate transporter substrate-binding protein [Hyphomicrobiaceae bacterium]
MWQRSLFKAATAAIVALLPAVTPAWAQGYPNKPITIIVPAGAGGPTDTVARLVGESMSRTLGQQIIVENVGGAGGTIGVGRVAKSAPDGYTLVVWHIGQATAPALYDNLKYNVLDDFDSIGRITDVPMTIVGKAGLEAKSIGDLLTWLKAKQKDVTYAHAGIGSASHLCALLLMSAIKVEMTAVSYRGTGPAMNDLVGGQFDMMCDQTTGTTNQIKEGKIKGYAATTAQRLKVLPELPTLAESGLKGFEVSAWHAMWAPKGIPAEASSKLVAALQSALKDEKVIERFASLGTEPVAPNQATPEALKAQLTAELDKWGPVIKASGAKGAN